MAKTPSFERFPPPHMLRRGIEHYEKFRWVIENYDALWPEGQYAIDLALIALPRRPVAEQVLPAQVRDRGALVLTHLAPDAEVGLGTAARRRRRTA